VGYEQFTRALNAVDPAVLGGALRGLSAMTQKQAYALRESAQRNDIWLIDHYEVLVFVHWPGFRNPVKPWQTTLLDDKHRTVVGAVWWPKPPTAEEAVAAAVRGFTLPDGSFVGGAPHILLMDQGAELIGEKPTSAYLSMRIDPQPAPARAPWVKGKLEILHHNVLDAGFASFPGWTGGPIDTAGRQILTTPATELLDRDTFRERAWEVIAAYNAAHEHSALGGVTPLESWLADPAPVRQLDDAILRQHWLTETRKVSGKGVQLHSLQYQHGLLGQDVGRELETRQQRRLRAGGAGIAGAGCTTVGLASSQPADRLQPG
jgi:putative transposase